MKIKTILLILFVCVFMQSAYAADEITNGALRLSLVNQQPDPVEPGEYVDVRFRIENIGDESLDDIQIEAMPEYPFSLDPGDEKVKEITSLSPFQKDARGYIIKYRLRVDNNAVEGENTLKVRVKTGNKDWTTYQFDLDVLTTDANLEINSVTTDPSPAKPGEDTTITIKAKNLADSTLKDIKFNLDLTLESFGQKQLDSLPFAPLNTGTEKKISSLGSGEEVTLSYDLRVYPTAQSKVYQLPLVMEYYDELNNKYQKNEIIGMVVNSEPELSVILEQDEGGFTPGKSGEVSVRFTNKGLTNIKFLTATIKPTTEFESVSSDEVYLGNIDSDDYEIADYQIYINQTNKDTILIPVHFEYMDANNNKYTANKDLRLQILTNQQAQKLGLQEQGGINPLIYLAIAIVVLFIAYRFYKKRKQN